MKFLKKLFRRPAIILVTWWANIAYKKGVEAANHRSAREKKVIYLASETFHPDRLVTYSKEQFKAQKRAFGYHARLLTMQTLSQRCYYHTADQFGKNGLGKHEIETRRRAFIKERLRMAKLI